jgi:hypothetical protein
MPLKVHVRITGKEETIQKLKKLGQSFYTFEAAMDDIGEKLTTFYRDTVMSSEGSAIGEPWDQLSSPYVIRKATGNTRKKPLGKGAYPGAGILVASGKMQSSFDYSKTAKSVTIKNTDPKFKYHNSDEERTSNLPRRQVFKVTDAVNDMVNAIIDADIQKKIRKAGL